jgi:sulfur-carrier protein
MKVLVPTPLRSYTGGAAEVDSSGRTLGEVVADLDHRFPGIRFRMIDEQDRIRPHMRIFVNGEQEFSLGRVIEPGDDIQILQALSGG